MAKEWTEAPSAVFGLDASASETTTTEAWKRTAVIKTIARRDDRFVKMVELGNGRGMSGTIVLMDAVGYLVSGNAV